MSSILFLIWMLFIVQKGGFTVNGSDAFETIRVATMLQAPFVMEKSSSEGSPGAPVQYEGLMVDLIQSIIEEMKINNYELVISESPSEMVDKVIRHEVDLAGPLMITAYNEKIMDQIVTPILSTGTVLVAKKPQEQDDSWAYHMNLVFRPFTVAAWCLIVLATLATGVVMYLMHRWLLPPPAVESSNRVGFLEALWWAWRTFLLQGNSFIYTSSMASRVLSGTFHAFSLLIILVYVVFLSQKMTENPPKAAGSVTLPFQSPEDLLQQWKIKFGVVNGSYDETFFKTSIKSTYEQMWGRMLEDNAPFADSIDHGIQKVRESNGNFVLITDAISAAYSLNRLPCDLVQVGGRLNSVGVGLGLPIEHELYDYVQLVILQLKEGGKIAELQHKWFTAQSECPDTKTVSGGKQEEEVLPPADVYVIAIPLLILAVGIIVAVAIAGVQLVRKRRETGELEHDQK